MGGPAAALPRVTIVGVGLIGGSLALSWKARGVVSEVVGVARREESIAEAQEVGAVDHGTLSLAEGVKDADVVVVATPVRTIVSTALSIKRHLKPGAVVTDVGSTKAWLCHEIWRHYRTDALFIGGHPMAGSERAGVTAADPYLFQNAPYILVPSQVESPHQRIAVETLERLASATGAIPLIMSAQEHDAIVATVSHLPHLVAASLVNTASARSEEYTRLLQLAAGGFRDTTRVASGPEAVWTDICRTNAQPIKESIRAFIAELERLEAAVCNEDDDALGSLLSRARSTRESLPEKSKGILGTVFDIVVDVVDRPRSIHDVTGIVGDAGINIIDIEILRVREGEGGTLRLGFECEADHKKALQLLLSHGYRARSR